MVFAQLPTPVTPPVGGDSAFWNPSNWVGIARELGIGGFLLIVFVLVVSFLTYKTLSWTVGKGGWVREVVGKTYDRLDVFIGKIEENGATTSRTLATLENNCDRYHAPGGNCNVVDMRDAGHEFAELGRSLAVGTSNADKVGQHADTIHRLLRSRGDDVEHDACGTIAVGKSQRDVNP